MIAVNAFPDIRSIWPSYFSAEFPYSPLPEITGITSTKYTKLIRACIFTKKFRNIHNLKKIIITVINKIGTNSVKDRFKDHIFLLFSSSHIYTDDRIKTRIFSIETSI